jgi:hypothetical protein
MQKLIGVYAVRQCRVVCLNTGTPPAVHRLEIGSDVVVVSPFGELADQQPPTLDVVVCHDGALVFHQTGCALKQRGCFARQAFVGEQDADESTLHALDQRDPVATSLGGGEEVVSQTSEGGNSLSRSSSRVPINSMA